MAFFEFTLQYAGQYGSEHIKNWGQNVSKQKKLGAVWFQAKKNWGHYGSKHIQNWGQYGSKQKKIGGIMVPSILKIGGSMVPSRKNRGSMVSSKKN